MLFRSAKKMAMFHRGFNPELKYALTNIKADNFEDLINIALREEHARKLVEESRKHSREVAASSKAIMPPQKRRIWVPYANPTPPNFLPRPAGFLPRPPTPALTDPKLSMGQPKPPLHRPGVTCFKCGQQGQYSNKCPQHHLPLPPHPNSSIL